MLHTTSKYNFLTVGFIAKTASEGKYHMVFHCGNHCAAAFKGNFGVYLNDFFEAFSFQPGGWSSVKLLGFTCFQSKSQR